MIAAVILAHADPTQVRRLIGALDGIPVFLHCDAGTRPDVHHAMTDGLPSRVTLVPRIRTSLNSWSLVQAEINGLRAAVRATGADHIAVLSGSDYPLVPPNELDLELKRWAGTSWIWNAPLPIASWGSRRHPDGGMWRLRYRYWTRDDQVLSWRGHPLRWPLRRNPPDGIEPRGNSQWKIYARHHAELLLRIVDERPDLVRYWRTTLVPDETFVASILGSARLAGADALRPSRVSAWYLDWDNPASPGHPSWLGEPDFDRLRDARRAPPADPDTAPTVPPGRATGFRKLFARKITDRALLDRIDRELRI